MARTSRLTSLHLPQDVVQIGINRFKNQIEQQTNTRTTALLQKGGRKSAAFKQSKIEKLNQALFSNRVQRAVS